MISLRQVHLVEDHWNSIADRALGRIRREVPHSEGVSDRVILERVEELFGHLGDWLTAADPQKIERFEDFGRKRAAGHTQLHELVRMLQIIRQCAIDYARDNELNESAALLRAEYELEYSIDRFFDLVIFHVVKGYEMALRHEHSVAAAAHAH